MCTCFLSPACLRQCLFVSVFVSVFVELVFSVFWNGVPHLPTDSRSAFHEIFSSTLARRKKFGWPAVPSDRLLTTTTPSSSSQRSVLQACSPRRRDSKSSITEKFGGHNLRYEIINRTICIFIYMFACIVCIMYCIISYACGERQCGTTMT